MTLWDFYATHRHPAILPLLRVSWRGLRIDVDKRQAAIGEYTAMEGLLAQELHQLVGRPLDPHSPKQLMEYVYTEHHVKPVLRLRKGALERGYTPTLDEEAIEELMTREVPSGVRAVLQLILQIRGTHKILATYLQAPLDSDNRLRCSYALAGTETGRLSSRETPFRTGTNLQNVPTGIAREMVVPDEGLVFVVADLSQAEARVVAYLAKESRLIDIFHQGGDIHRRNAASIYRVAESAVTPEQRYLAKRVVHASNYGMGANKFARVAGITKGEATRLLTLYFTRYPRIKVWHLEVADTLRRTRTLTTPLGWRRQFFGAWSDDLLREAYSFVPQSTVADLLNDGLVAYEEERPGEILLQVHDSILLQVRPADVPIVRQTLTKHLVRPLDIGGQSCIIPIDVKTGPSWNGVH